MAKQPQEPEVVEVPAPKTKKKGMLLSILLGVALLGAGGGVWFALGGGADTPQGVETPEKPAGPPVFFALETFTVNLQPAGSEHFLQTEITLRVQSQSIVDKIRLHMPEVRNRILFLLSSKNASELVTSSGKENLAEELRIEISRLVDPDSVPAPPPVKIRKLAGLPAQDAPAVGADQEPDGEPEDEPEEEPEEPEEAAEPSEPQVLRVLFTSFIIQ